MLRLENKIDAELLKNIMTEKEEPRLKKSR